MPSDVHPAGSGGWPIEDIPLYQEIAENAVKATGARLVNLARFDPRDSTICGVAWASAPDARYEQALAQARRLVLDIEPTRLSFPATANAVTRAVHLEGRTQLVAFEDAAGGTMAAEVLRIASRVMGLRFTLSVPLKLDEEVVGSLSFHFAHQPSDGAHRTAEAFARQAALTLENARLSASLHERIEEIRLSEERVIASEERTRQEIAELLHSQVQAKLLVASHRLWQCRDLARTDPSQAEAVLRELAEEIDRIREQDVRQASHLLHPSIIRTGLVPALYFLAERFEPSFHVAIAVEPALAALDDPVQNRLPEPLRLTAYRLVEEALGNAARHSKASQVEVGLDIKSIRAQRGLAITVRDNGAGFDAASVQPGLGLRSLDARIEQLGGTWRIESEPDGGTTLTVVLPLSTTDEPRSS